MRNQYRKIAKNNWQYTCKNCGFRHQSIDEFGAYEAEWRHRKYLPCVWEQAIKPMREAFKVIADAVRPVMDAMNALNPPPGPTQMKYPTSTNPNQNRRKK